MEFKEWILEFSDILKEHNLNPTEIDKIITVKHKDLKKAFLNKRDPELSMYSIAGPFLKAKGVAEGKRIYDKYSAHDPRCFSISHCLNTYINRLYIRNTFRDYLKSRPIAKNQGHNQIGGKFKIFEENLDCGSVIPDDGYSKIVEILVDHIDNSSNDMALVVSVLESKYSIIQELISAKSGIPLVLLKAGLPGVENQQTWDDLAIAADTFINAQLFFMDIVEPVGIEKFTEQINMACGKGNFKRIIITGLSYLEEFNTEEKGRFKESLQHLEKFADHNGVEFLAIP